VVSSSQQRPSRRSQIVVVSPHLDDGVLSLGASMASWARRGETVGLLTVLAGDPASSAPAGGWDRRGGFATEGDSARARREEDRRACTMLGVTPVWLPFGSVDYERHGDEDDVRDAVGAALDGADTVLLPGYPLSHPDHAWLADVLDGGVLGGRRVGLYAEQPYALRARVSPTTASRSAVEARFARSPVGLRDRFAKVRAIRRYTSQLPLLAMRRSLRRGPHRHAASPEWIAWVPE
jgi:LmbE family N-acetylglucosaminyl deacetylase